MNSYPDQQREDSVFSNIPAPIPRYENYDHAAISRLWTPPPGREMSPNSANQTSYLASFPAPFTGVPPSGPLGLPPYVPYFPPLSYDGSLPPINPAFTPEPFMPSFPSMSPIPTHNLQREMTPGDGSFPQTLPFTPDPFMAPFPLMPPHLVPHNLPCEISQKEGSLPAIFPAFTPEPLMPPFPHFNFPRQMSLTPGPVDSTATDGSVTPPATVKTFSQSLMATPPPISSFPPPLPINSFPPHPIQSFPTPLDNSFSTSPDMNTFTYPTSRECTPLDSNLPGSPGKGNLSSVNPPNYPLFSSQNPLMILTPPPPDMQVYGAIYGQLYPVLKTKEEGESASSASLEVEPNAADSPAKSAESWEPITPTKITHSIQPAAYEEAEIEVSTPTKTTWSISPFQETEAEVEQKEVPEEIVPIVLSTPPRKIRPATPTPKSEKKRVKQRKQTNSAKKTTSSERTPVEESETSNSVEQTQAEQPAEKPAEKKKTKKFGFRSKQIMIDKVFNSLQKKYSALGLLASADEVLRGLDTIRIHVKKFKALQKIEEALEALEEVGITFARISTPLSMKNQFQKKGFLVYIKLAHIDMVEATKTILQRYDEFKKSDVARHMPVQADEPVEAESANIESAVPLPEPIEIDVSTEPVQSADLNSRTSESAETEPVSFRVQDKENIFAIFPLPVESIIPRLSKKDKRGAAESDLKAAPLLDKSVKFANVS